MKTITIEDAKVTMQALGLVAGDVLVLKCEDKEIAAGYAEGVSKTGILPAGTPIIVLGPDVDIDALRNAPPELKQQITEACK